MDLRGLGAKKGLGFGLRGFERMRLGVFWAYWMSSLETLETLGV